MLRTKVESDYRVRIPIELRESLQVGEELFVKVDHDGHILLIPKAHALEILERTAGMWQGRTDMPEDGVAYVNQLRQGHRLHDLGCSSRCDCT